MPDKRLTELDAMVDDLAGDDVFPFTDVSAATGSGITKKLELQQLIPADGTPGQVLERGASETDPYDLEWADRPSPQFATLTHRLANGVDGVYTASGLYYTVPFDLWTDPAPDAADKNYISGLSVDTPGLITLPNGLFSLQANISVRVNRNGGWSICAASLWKEPATPLYPGLSIRLYYGHNEATLTISRLLSVDDGNPGAGNGVDFSIRTRSVNASHAINETYSSWDDSNFTHRTAAELIIQKIS